MYAPIFLEIKDVYRQLGSYKATARELNARGILTRNHKQWDHTAVRRVLQRFE